MPRPSSLSRAARTRTGRSPSSHRTAATPGSARCGATTRAASALTLLYEATDKHVLEGPDNVAISPRGATVLCQDGDFPQNFIRGLTASGDIVDFALNLTPGAGGVRGRDVHARWHVADRPHPGAGGSRSRSPGHGGTACSDAATLARDESADARGTRGHGLDPRRHLPHGLRPPLPGGGARAPGHASTASGWTSTPSPTPSSRASSRRPATSRVAERAAEPRRLSRRATRSCSCPRSVVFRKPPRRVDLRNPYNWWTYVPGADWRHPRGPGSSTRRTADDHPVVHVAWRTPKPTRAWAGKELPTEAEWEFAARGGLDGAEYAWGDEFTPGGKHDGQHLAGRVPVAEPARRRLRRHRAGRLASRPTATASTTWPATSGSGRPTGTRPRHRDRQQPCCARRRIRAAASASDSYDPRRPDVQHPAQGA